MKKGESHPSKTRSRKEIVLALLSLMEGGDFKDITVSQISDESRLTRRTFYAHFKDKEEVLRYRIGVLNRQLLDKTGEIDPENRRELLLCYFRFWMGHSEFLNLMNRNGLLILIQEGLSGYVRGLRVRYACSMKDEKKEIFYGYTNAALSGLLWGLLKKWIDRDWKETPEELILKAEEIIKVLCDTLNREL